MRHFDVIVAGAGVAGVAAAVASAREGASTLLIEREPMLGGTARLAMIRHICGLYANDIEGEVEAGDTLNPGLQSEVAGMVFKDTGIRPERAGRVRLLPLMPDTLTRVLDELLAPVGKRLNVSGFTRMISAKLGDDNKLAYIEDDKEGMAEAGAFVDATGNAELGLMAGLETRAPEARQLAGYTVRLKGVDTKVENLNLKVPYAMHEAAEKKVVPDEFRFIQFSYGHEKGEGLLKFSVMPSEAGMDSSFIGFGAMSGLERAVEEALTYLGAHVPALENAVISESAEGVAERDALRRVEGEYTLTEDDVTASRRFDDEVCLNAWPMELWEPGKGPVYTYPSDPNGYGVPLRSLKAKGVSNLFLAGRCVSATREAMGSLRVTGACIATGEQAGILAARSALSG